MNAFAKIRRLGGGGFIVGLACGALFAIPWQARADPMRPPVQPRMVLAGHAPNIMPAVNRYTGTVTALGGPDAEGRIFSFQAKPLGPRTAPRTPNDLVGWRLTILSGERFSRTFEVRSNTVSEISVLPVDGPLNGVAVDDVFVVEQIEIVREPNSGESAPAKQ